MRAHATAFTLAGGAAAYAAALPPLDLWPLAYVALVPWLLGVRRSRPGGAVLLGFAYGTAAGMLLGAWVPASLARLGASPVEAWIGLAWITALSLGVGFGLAGAVLSLARGWGPVPWTLAAALTVGVVDALRSSTAFGTPFGLVGHTQGSVVGVAQLAAGGGVPAISALVAWVNASLACVLGARTPAPGARVALAGGLGAVAALVWLGFPVAQALGPGGDPTRRVRVLAIQPNVPFEERWVPEIEASHLRSLGGLVRESLYREPASDLVVLPETTVTSPLDGDSKLRGQLMDLFRETGRLGVVGVVRTARSGDPHHYRSSVLAVDANGQMVDALDKAVAIPVLESSRSRPLLALLAPTLGEAGRLPKVEEWESGRSLRVGNHRFAVALCYEALFPGLVAARSQGRPTAILALANDSWIVGTEGAEQQITFASFRAIEQRLPLLRVSHGGPTVALDAYGRITERLPAGSAGALGYELAPTPAPGRMARLAPWIVAAGGAGSAGLVHQLAWRKRHASPRPRYARPAPGVGARVE